MTNQSRLGRGLEALIPKPNISVGEQILKVPVDTIAPNPHQPRQELDNDSLLDLVESIKIHGVLQPLIVRQHLAGSYQLIAGERRLQASRKAGLTEVPVLIREVEKQLQLELAIVENVQRKDLNAIEEAMAYRQLRDEFNLSLKQIGQRVGKKVPTISNKIRLLDLPSEILQGLQQEKISEGHARALLAFDSAEKMLLAYGQILHDKLSVREVESLVRAKLPKSSPLKAADKSAARWSQETESLQRRFGTRVSITGRAGKGTIQLAYGSEEELRRLLELLEG